MSHRRELVQTLAEYLDILPADRLELLLSVIEVLPAAAIEDKSLQREYIVDDTPLGELNRARFVAHIARLQARLDEAQNDIAKRDAELMDLREQVARRPAA